jgi:hypothetical protein
VPSFQPFGYQGEENTCLWCGRPLYFRRVIADDSDKDNPTWQPPKDAYSWPTVQAPRRGAYYDGMFDTMGCGYMFGKRMGELGHRLRPARAGGQEQEN